MTVNTEPLRSRNAERAAEAASRNQQLARDALSWLAVKTGSYPAMWRHVARARIDYPDETWGQIASRLGTTRYAATSAFRRLIVAAGLRTNGPGRYEDLGGTP